MDVGSVSSQIVLPVERFPAVPAPPGVFSMHCPNVSLDRTLRAAPLITHRAVVTKMATVKLVSHELPFRSIDTCTTSDIANNTLLKVDWLLPCVHSRRWPPFGKGDPLHYPSRRTLEFVVSGFWWCKHWCVSWTVVRQLWLLPVDLRKQIQWWVQIEGNFASFWSCFLLMQAKKES